MMSDYAATVLMTEVARRAAVSAPGIGFELLSNNVPVPVEHLDRTEVDLLVMPEDVVPGSHPKDRLFEDEPGVRSRSRAGIASKLCSFSK